MAPRQRTRAFNLPAHIHIRDIPTGVYWDKSSKRWFVFVIKDGRKARETIGTRDDRASDLHRKMEERGGVRRETLGHLMDLFHASPQFAKLAERTRADYERYRAIAKAQETRVGKLGDIPHTRCSPQMFRGMLDIYADTPTKGNHQVRYLKRVFSWAMKWGYSRATTNPLSGVDMLDEVAANKMPTPEQHKAFLNSIDGWLWAACEIAYLCRLRRVEVVTLTEANATADGVISNRTKGSEDNLTEWSPRLRNAWNMALAERDKAWKRRASKGAVIPIRADQRPLFAGRHVGAMTEDGFSGAFGKAMQAFAAKGGVRFSIHGLKHRGITDSPDKRAGGHKTEAMRQHYDHQVKRFRPSGE